MHREILSDRQLDLLPLMAKFKREYYLVGGTAIALHIGHRRSIDFDLFKLSGLNHKKNLARIALGAAVAPTGVRGVGQTFDPDLRHSVILRSLLE